MFNDTKPRETTKYITLKATLTTALFRLFLAEPMTPIFFLLCVKSLFSLACIWIIELAFPFPFYSAVCTKKSKEGFFL